MATRTTTNFAAGTTYSPFFSSGLLAAHTPRRSRRGTTSSDASSSWGDEDSPPPSPATASSPAHPHGQFANTPMDVDDDVDMCGGGAPIAGLGSRMSTPLSRRSATPTPATVGAGAAGKATGKNGALGTPRLRRRRSSLSLAHAATSVGALRTPARAAEHALHVQRARSGSLGGDVGLAALSIGSDGAVAGTLAGGRTRSGSLGARAAAAGLGVAGAGGTTAGLRPRRAVRRIGTMPVPGPRAPPPTAPLPALPLTPTAASISVIHTGSGAPMQDILDRDSTNLTPTPGHPHLRPTKVNFSAPATADGAAKPAPTRTSARARGLSVSGSTMGGVEHRIEEDAKES